MEKEIANFKRIQTPINLLETVGYDAYLVGGSVRDFLLGKQPDDIDITTNATPGEMMLVFQDYRIIETGLKHGTITVLMGGKPVEITTYRIDGKYTDHRRPDRVQFSSDLKEDLSRRDFTINAMAWSPTKGVVDLFGGKKDLDAKIIRCVGHAEDRFEEDALRILRALRFASVLGFEIEGETSKAIFAKKELLRAISAERVWVELKKLLLGVNAREILLRYVDVLGVVIPELLPMKGFQQNNPYHIYDVWEHTARVVENADSHLKVAALFHDIGKPQTYTLDEKGLGHFYGHGEVGAEMTEGILRRLKTDRLTQERVCQIVRYHDVKVSPTKKNVKRWLRKLGPEVLLEIFDLKRADNLAQNLEYHNVQERIADLKRITEEVIREGECFSQKDLAITGRDLKAYGVPQGPAIGQQLDKLLDLVIEGKVENKKEALLKALPEFKR